MAGMAHLNSLLQFGMKFNTLNLFSLYPRHLILGGGKKVLDMIGHYGLQPMQKQ